MSKTYRDLVIEDLRLAILRLLDMDGGGSSNVHILYRALECGGHPDVSRDHLETQLSWLEEQGLVHLERPGDVLVIKLRLRGQEAARGKASVPGVKRPDLED